MVFIYLIAAVLLSLVITPAVKKLNILDKPDYRKIHDKPIPKAGGIGIFFPIILLEAAAFIFFKECMSLPQSKYLAIVFATSILLTAGIIDDKFELKAKVKLMIQMVITVFTLMCGISFRIFDAEVLNLLFTACWIIGIINALNLIDGLDGLAAGITMISCIGFCIVGYICMDNTVVFLSMIIVGACLGFLKYNFRPAGIFMGDAGSVPLGYNLAVLGILSQNVMQGKTSVIIPVIILGVPIFDTLLTVFRRYKNHKPVFQPDRSHFYNLLIDIKGMEHKNTVLLIWAINVLLVLFSTALVFLNYRFRFITICLIILAAALLSWKMGFIKTDIRKPK